MVRGPKRTVVVLTDLEGQSGSAEEHDTEENEWRR
jgi:hypothetical protein